MAKRVFETVSDLKDMVGKEVGVSDWCEVTQDKINAFAEATGDHQWIHVEPERAKKESPYGTTIAHGYFTLSLAPMLLAEILEVKKRRMSINYGLNKLRFPNAVKVGSKVRMHATLSSMEEVKGGVQLVFTFTFEIKGQEKPACVAEALYRYYN
jgi:acyl dehydratase